MITIQIIIIVVQALIAMFLAYIGYQNYKISKYNLGVHVDELRLSLFDRRYVIYSALQNFLGHVMQRGGVELARLSEFSGKTSDSNFLFGDDIKDYIKAVYEKGLHLHFIVEKLSDRDLGVGEERSKLAKEAESLELWFGKQFEESNIIFKKYMEFPIREAKL